MTKEMMIREKNITDNVLNRVNMMQTEGSLQMPDNYSPQNALKSAYLKLLETKTRDKKPVLQACSEESIANSLLDMVVQGLNPMKNQGYFIPYGNQLTFQRSYLGTIAITKRIKGVKDVKAYALYEGDEFETEFDLMTGSMKVVKYDPKLENINKDKLKGAFALIVGEEGILHVEVMSMEQVKAAWNMGSMGGKSGAHKDFGSEMAKRTVINRACKMYANTSDDSDLVMEQLDKTSTELDIEVVENANQEVLEFEEDESIPDIKETEVVDNETGEIIEESDKDRIDGPPF